MEEIIKEYGGGLISGTAAVLLISLFIAMLQPGGILNRAVEALFTGMAG